MLGWIGTLKPASKTKRKPRAQLTRRRLNDAWYGFGDPNGNFSWSKFIATAGQLAALLQFGVHFETLIKTPESLGIIVTVIIFPEVIKKWVSMKYGVSGGKK